MTIPVRSGDRGRTASLVTLGMAILAVSHLGLYLFLTADARSHMAAIETEVSLEHLESAREPGPAPMAGTEAYSPWLRTYERWHASKAHGLHARHEGMIRLGMILSFLIGLGLVGASVHRAAPQRRRRTAQVAVRRPAANHSPAPARRPATVRRPPARPRPAHAARRPARVLPMAPARAAVKPLRVRRSA